MLGTGVATFSAPSSTVVMTSLSIDNTARLDIGSTKLIIHSADQNTLRSNLQNGYDAGAWDKGLHSSQAAVNPAIGIGYLLNTGTGGNPIYPTFGGQPATATDTLVRFTYFGDANLDGNVNALDFNRLAINFGKTPGSDVWSQGDFNFDGIVNTLDFNALASNFNATPLSGSGAWLTCPRAGGDHSGLDSCRPCIAPQTKKSGNSDWNTASTPHM